MVNFEQRVLACELRLSPPKAAPMCEQCDKLKDQISHDRRFLNQRFDELTELRIKVFIGTAERDDAPGS
jgi:hypothetical protein